MKILFLFLSILLLSCSAKKSDVPKSIDEFRAEAAAADKEACRLDEIRSKIDEELLAMDSIYYESGEEQEYKVKIDSLQHIIDSLDVLIGEQTKNMNKAQHDCDSIHHTWAL